MKLCPTHTNPPKFVLLSILTLHYIDLVVTFTPITPNPDIYFNPNYYQWIFNPNPNLKLI